MPRKCINMNAASKRSLGEGVGVHESMRHEDHNTLPSPLSYRGAKIFQTMRCRRRRKQPRAEKSTREDMYATLRSANACAVLSSPSRRRDSSGSARPMQKRGARFASATRMAERTTFGSMPTTPLAKSMLEIVGYL